MSLQMISRDKIRRAFPPERTPNTIPLVESAQGIDEEMMETADVFRGKHWDELTAKDFAPNVSFMGFLTYAWQWYYLPALVCCSLEELQTVGYLSDTDMAVDSIISTLDLFTYPECNAVENMRKIFSKEQATIVKDWIYLLTLSTNDIPVHADHLIIFLEKYAIGAYFKR